MHKLAGRSVVFVSAVLALTYTSSSHSQIQGCPAGAAGAGNKLVIGSVTELVGQVDTRLSRALLAAFEMRFEMAKAELDEEVQIIYCKNRHIPDSSTYDKDVVQTLNDQRLLLEVGAQPDGSDIKVTYVVVPMRYYGFTSEPSQSSGYHEALYEKEQGAADLERLFKGNAELRLMAALALALRHEKIAENEPDPAARRSFIHRSRAFYCEAVGSLDAARPRSGYLGLAEPEWEALREFAQSGARRMFAIATSDPDYDSTLAAVASERGGNGSEIDECIQ